MATQVHECRNCGAPLDIPTEHERYFTCRYCGSVLEDTASDDQRRAGAFEIRIAVDPGVDREALTSYARPARAAKAVIGVIVAVFAVSTIGALVAAVAGSDGVSSITEAFDSDGGPDVYGYGAGAVVPADDGSEDDLVLAVRGADEGSIAYADLDDRSGNRFRWRVKHDFESDTFTQFLATDDRVLVSNAADVLALDRATGAEVWTARLSDEIQPTLCRDCFRIHGGVVVTLSVDGVLAGHSVATGEKQWSVTLAETPRQIVSVGPDIGVLDRPADDVVLRVFAPAGGAERPARALTCPDQTFGGRRSIGLYESLFPVADGFLSIADPSFGGCIQRWGPAPQPVWEVPFEVADPSGVEPDNVVRSGGGGRIAVGLADRVDVVDVASGAVTASTTLADVDVFPVALVGNAVVVGAERTRGTSAWSLRGVVGGAERWTFELEGGDPHDPFASPHVSGDAWLARPTSTGVAVLQVRDDKGQVVLHTITPDTGMPTAPVVFDLGEPAATFGVSILGWVGDRIHLAQQSRLLVIDVPTGRIVADRP